MGEVWHMRRQIDVPFNNCSAPRKGRENVWQIDVAYAGISTLR
jgi:hypothetical protein